MQRESTDSSTSSENLLINTPHTLPTAPFAPTAPTDTTQPTPKATSQPPPPPHSPKALTPKANNNSSSSSSSNGRGIPQGDPLPPNLTKHFTEALSNLRCFFNTPSATPQQIYQETLHTLLLHPVFDNAIPTKAAPPTSPPPLRPFKAAPAETTIPQIRSPPTKAFYVVPGPLQRPPPTYKTPPPAIAKAKPKPNNPQEAPQDNVSTTDEN